MPDQPRAADMDVSQVASKEGLNGAQIRAVLDVVGQRNDGLIDDEAAIELMVAVGMTRASAMRVL